MFGLTPSKARLARYEQLVAEERAVSEQPRKERSAGPSDASCLPSRKR